MVEICKHCGLPVDICVCAQLNDEQLDIVIRCETRKRGRIVTIITGVNREREEIARSLRALCACGGSDKNGQILLQGDQREKTKQFLIKKGYPAEKIEVR